MLSEDSIIKDEIITEIDIFVFNEVDKILQELYKRNTSVKELTFICENVAFYYE